MLERGRWSAANNARCPRRVVRALACRVDRFAFVEVTACGFAHAAIATRPRVNNVCSSLAGHPAVRPRGRPSTVETTFSRVQVIFRGHHASTLTRTRVLAFDLLATGSCQRKHRLVMTERQVLNCVIWIFEMYETVGYAHMRWLDAMCI
jgi:hypothetical protein